MENVVKKFLLDLGVKPSLLGFDYLVDAISICFSDNTYRHGTTTKLYPYIAKKNNSTPSRVERCIRNAIESADRVSSKIEEELIITRSYNTGNYTNSQFICACVEKLKMEGQNV